MAGRYGAVVSYEGEFLFNNSATAISAGHAVLWSGTVYSMPDPIPECAGGKKPMLANQATRSTAVTRPTMGIARVCTAADTNNYPIGVAVEDIGVTSWGLVAVRGICDVRIGASQNIAAGDYLVCATTGCFVEDVTSVTATTLIYAMALEATITSGTCAAALISALLNIPMAGGAMNKRT